MLDVTIVITAREAFSTTLTSLETILAHSPEDVKIVFVASGFPTEIMKSVESLTESRSVEIVYIDHFLTPNQARNVGLEKVKTRYVAFVDNDIIASENWLDHLVKCAVEENATLVSPLIFERFPHFKYIHVAGGEVEIKKEKNGRRIYHEKHYLFRHDNLQDPQVFNRSETQLVEFHTVLVDAHYLQKAGGLDEELLAYSEHWDLCINVLNENRKIFLEPQSKVTHLPPFEATKDDIRFFNLRWSEKWFGPSVKRLIRKYELDPKSGAFNGGRWFLRDHRLHKYGKYRKVLLPLFGPRISNKLLRMTFGKWDQLTNNFVIRKDYNKWSSFPSRGGKI